MSTTLLDLDSMLEQNLDNVEAAPEFIEPPNGKYQLTVKSAKIASKDKTNEDGEEETTHRINVVYAIAKTYEVADGEVPAPDGSLFSEGFMVSEEGLKYFKARAQKLLGAEVIKGVTIKNIIEALPDAKPFDAMIRIRVSKIKGKEYRNVNLTVAGEEATA